MADDGVVVSRQTSVGDKAVVAKLDWVEWTQSLRKLSLALWTLFPALVGMVALVTWLSAKATFVPLQEMTNQASAIGGSDLSARIDVEDAAEFGMFAHQLNGLLGRIEQAVKTQEQFAADAAHELRTPLTVMQGKLETALLSKRTPTEYAETLRAVLGEVGRLSRLTEALLQTAKPDEAAPPPLELEPIVSDVASRWLDRFVSKGLDLHVATSAAEAPIKREEIECVLDNLLENAFRYSPPGTGCSVELDTNDQRVELSVEDSGSGLAGAAGEKAFERFWREDEARSRQSGGFGLGLAICKKLVEARGGKIFVDDSYRKGTRIVVSFKASSRA
jgi:signal transduction histidine kinase